MSKAGPDFSALKVASAVAVPLPMKAPLSFAPAVPSTSWLLRFVSVPSVLEMKTRYAGVAAKRRIRLGQEIGLAIRRHAALVEHEGRESNVGRIGTLARAVADVGGDQVEIADVQRLEGALIDVRHVALLNLEVVDLQRIDRLERVLPA